METNSPDARLKMEDSATVGETRSQTKEEALEQHQQELDEIVDAHDDSVRLLFQLDRFVTLVDYDPAIAKRRSSARPGCKNEADRSRIDGIRG